MTSYVQKAGIAVRIAVTTLLIVFTVGNAALGRLLGEPSNLEAMLAPLIEPLERNGIDVVAGDTSAMLEPMRPRIALLPGMPENRPADKGDASWMEDFKSGAAGFVAGAQIDRPGHAATTQDAFLSEWQKASTEKRVFLSFTSADVDIAHVAAKALQANGYVTFAYLNPNEKQPRMNPAVVGKLFSEAGHHLVLDTANARKSPGVWFEANQARALSGSSEKPLASRGGSGGSVATKRFDERSFLDGVSNRWVVTENPETPGKLFVHREMRNNTLVDMLYLVQIEADGSWTVKKPGDGNQNAPLGSIKRPPVVNIGQCNCK